MLVPGVVNTVVVTPVGPDGPDGPDTPVEPVGPDGPEGPDGPAGPDGPDGPEESCSFVAKSVAADASAEELPPCIFKPSVSIAMVV